MTFRKNDLWVKDFHRTPEPENSTYSGIVSQDSVKIVLTYSALNGLDVCECEIKNAYLQILSSDKHFIICGP